MVAIAGLGRQYQLNIWIYYGHRIHSVYDVWGKGYTVM